MYVFFSKLILWFQFTSICLVIQVLKYIHASVSVCMDECMYGWVDVWMSGCMDECVYGWVCVCMSWCMWVNGRRQNVDTLYIVTCICMIYCDTSIAYSCYCLYTYNRMSIISTKWNDIVQQRDKLWWQLTLKNFIKLSEKNCSITTIFDVWHNLYWDN